MSRRESPYVVPPPACARPVHELHAILTTTGSASMPGFFTRPDGAHVFHIEVQGDPDALELTLMASGWTTVERPA